MTTYSDLATIRERLTAEPIPSEADMTGMAASLPSSPSPDGRPETALVLAGLYARLWRHRREPHWPAWRAADLPPQVQIAWLRAEILNEPAVIRTEPRNELLYQAVRQVRIDDTLRPDQLVLEAADSGDPVLQAEALRLAGKGLHAGCLSPTRVRRHVLKLLTSADDDVVVSALERLAEPWAALNPLAPGTLTGFLARDSAAGDPRIPLAALAAAGRHGHTDLLGDAATDPGQNPVLRRRALELLGDLAERRRIPDLLGIAAQDPLLFGGPVADCLRGLHRRGHFLDDEEVPALLAVALADHTIPAELIATILFVSRQAAFRVLADATPADPGWPRRLDLLLALDGQGRGEVPVGEAVTRLLPSAPRPEPFLAAIRKLRHRNAEVAVIALLPTTPAAALSTLEAIGGRRTVAALRAGLGLTAGPAGAGAEGDPGATPIAPHLRADADQALALLWHLTRDLGERHALLDRLDPTSLPPRIAADLGGPDERETALLRSHLDPDKPVAALCRLAKAGSAGTVPVIADLLLRIVAELAAWREPGSPEWRLDSEPQTRDRFAPEPITGEPVVPQEVIDAVRGMGRRLHARRKLRPVCILDAGSPDAAGDALLASMALDLLDRPESSASEQAILLELLAQIPGAQARPRVHRLLRHPDRHVRKHAIALFARDVSGDDVHAVSATLIRLTAARDVQTVRQALLALGHVRARWAAEAIASGLDHPAMNIKKTAAETLARAGSPAAVPKLLFWLGRHDNPGFRALLVEALRAILGPAYAATLLAAAEAEGDDRARRLVLKGLDEALTVSALLALDDQQSPAMETLLPLVAAEEISLCSGSIDSLASVFARHGVTRPAATRRSPSVEGDAAVRALVASRWDPAIALRIAEMPDLPESWRSRKLQPYAADWLRLAATEVVIRRRLPYLLPGAPPSAGQAALASSVAVLLDGLAEAAAEDRGWFLEALAQAAAQLSAVDRLAVVDAVRALPPVASAVSTDSPWSVGAAMMRVLRRCDAVLVRADVERALAAAGHGPDPSGGQAALLREVFAPMRVANTPRDDEAVALADAWRVGLDAAIHTPGTLEAFRSRVDGLPCVRLRLDALIEVFESAGTEVRGALLAWMLVLQPLGAPSWTIAETALAPAPPPRVPREDDLDQPRSAAQRGRLLAMLESSDRERRDAAARALRIWPELDVRHAVLRAYLRGDIDERVGGPLADVVRTLGAAGLRADGVRPERVILAAADPRPGDSEVLIPLVLEWWQQGSATVRQASERFLRRMDPNLLAVLLGSRWEAGEYGFAQLLAGRTLLRTPLLAELCERLWLADGVQLVDGPLRGPGFRLRDGAALAALRDLAEVPKPAQPLSRGDLLGLARSGSPEQIRRALLRLVELHDAGTPDPDGADFAELADVLAGLLTHDKPKIRLQAHRTGRQLLDRATYLQHATVLLADPHPEVLRTAIRAVSHASWQPAVPGLVALVEHSHAVVRSEAVAGLVRCGTPAVAALRRAADHARPDRRAGFLAVLEAVAAGEAAMAGDRL